MDMRLPVQRCGMIRNGIKNIERRENMAQKTVNFLAFSISLMAHAKI